MKKLIHAVKNTFVYLLMLYFLFAFSLHVVDGVVEVIPFEDKAVITNDVAAFAGNTISSLRKREKKDILEKLKDEVAKGKHPMPIDEDESRRTQPFAVIRYIDEEEKLVSKL